MIGSSPHSSSAPPPDEWLLLSPLLDQALDLDEEQRRALIDAQDPQTASRLEALLLEHSLLDSDKFLEHGRIDLPSTGTTFEGQIIGPFRVESHIGQGGMGSVWRARRIDGRFERTVALKFLNVAFLGHSGEQRFRREGRILALLSDPHIAELIDAGVTAAGQPYLVLEYVDGQRIDQYCDQARLHIDSRIRLFLQVLDAVSTAHANLIVHRDIKPSNVLVRKDGEVKLLDFGIAKLLEREDPTTIQTALTLGSAALTPEFAAPEQLKHEPITVSTDVYSLGVLLYLLLTGRHPAGHHLHSPAELIKAIVDCEPVRPSDAVVGTFGPRSEDESLAALRSTTADRLQRALCGDLDTILLKALKKEPRERYASVSIFAADLRHYLACEPIGARPDTVMYRAGKFVRRHRTAVVLAALAFAGIAAGAAGTLIQSRTASTERDLALRHLARAERMTDLNELLLSDSAYAGKSLGVDQLLDREEHLIGREPNPDPANHVELLLSVGSQYSSEDHNDKALRVLNNAYALSRTLKNRTDRAIRAKASCVLAGALVPVGELAHAESLYQQGLRELENTNMPGEQALCYLRGSQIASQSGNTEQAILRARAAQEAIQGSPLRYSLQGINVLMNLASVLGDAGKFREADQRFQEVSSLMWDLGYDNSQLAAQLFNSWGMTQAYDGRQLEAEKTFRHALDVSHNDETNGTAAPLLLYNYASLLHQLGKDKEAAPYLQLASSKAHELHDNMLADDTDLLRAEMLTDDRQFGPAARLLDEVEQDLRQHYPPGHYVFAEVASARSAIATAVGDLHFATSLAQQAVALDEASVRKIGQCAAYLPTLLVQKSQIELRAGRADLAAADARRALELLENSAGTPSSNVGRASLALAQALQATGKQSDAQLASRIAFANLKTTLGPDHPATRLACQLSNSHAQPGHW